MKLLYAEDERAMSEAVTDILTFHKYIVDAVYNGEDALDYAKNEEYDGIILDIMMPKMSGLDGLNLHSDTLQRSEDLRDISDNGDRRTYRHAEEELNRRIARHGE